MSAAGNIWKKHAGHNQTYWRTESESYENISAIFLFISLAKPESQCFMSVRNIRFQSPNLNIIFWSEAVANFVEVLSYKPECRRFFSGWRRYLQLTSWRQSHLEEQTSSQLVMKFPTFYRTRRFITAFTSALHLYISWARSLQSMPPIPIPVVPL